MIKFYNAAQPHIQPACEKALAVLLIILSIIGGVLLVLSLGED